MDKYTAAAQTVNNIRQFTDRINNLDSLLEDLMVRPSPGEEELFKVKMTDYKSQLLELADDINFYIRTARQAQVADFNILKKEVESLKKEKSNLVNKVKELEVEIEELKNNNKDVENLKEVKDYLESLTPWLERFNSNQQRQGLTGQKSARFNHNVEDDKLIEAYKTSDYKITKEMQENFGMSYSGIKKRLVSLGEYKSKR